MPPALCSLSASAFRLEKNRKQLSSSVLCKFPHTGQTASYRLVREHVNTSSPLRVGVFFSGGQAPGGHNVVIALFEALREIHRESRLIGFLGGPEGLLHNRFFELHSERLAAYRNQGGFDLLGSGRTKIETEEQFQRVVDTLKERNLQGLVIIGGDDSNTNGALLAEWLAAKGYPFSLIGVPKTIDGDLRSDEIEIPFGFDSACRTYSESIGNIAKDAQSAKKYTHFIKLMGRSASHITLECALATHPNLAFLGEEIAAERGSLKKVVEQLAELIIQRSAQGKDYGVVLIPEGLIEFLPDMNQLMQELNRLLVHGEIPEEALSTPSRALFQELPEALRKQLLSERDPHGNVQLSQISTEELLIAQIKKELARRTFSGKFTPVPHFLGYEGRSAFPSHFDSRYSFALGRLAALAIRDRITGVIVAIQKLTRPPEEWTFSLQPLVQLMGFEMRQGIEKLVIRKALVDLTSAPFLRFAKARRSWALSDSYLQPGPMQFFGEFPWIKAPPEILL